MIFDPRPWIEVGDAPADRVVARVIADQAIAAVDPLLLRMIHTADVVPEGLPSYLQDFLVEELHLPLPEEVDDVQRAERFYGEHGLAITMLLGFASLPWTYTLRDGAAILVRTGQLTRHAERRVLETCQFVVDAFAPGGMEAGGAGLRDAQKVRLMHATIRSYTLQGGQWDVASRGVPVCQADLLATLCSFTHVVLDGLARMGVNVQPDDAQAWVTAWRVLGRNLGLDPRLMPRTPAEAQSHAEAVHALRAGPSPEGAQLATALSSFLESLGPELLTEHIVPTQIRFFLGDVLGDWLNLPAANASIHVIHAINRVDALLHRVEDVVPLAGSIGSGVGHALVTSLLAAERGGTRPPFSLPPSLQRAWNVGH